MIFKKIIYEILFWLFFIFTIAIVIWYFLGNSPTMEQALLILIITLLFKIQADIFFLKGEFKIIKQSHIKMSSDFKEHIGHK